jgi:hypothetical protein
MTLLFDHETFAVFELVEGVAFAAQRGILLLLVPPDGSIDFILE